MTVNTNKNRIRYQGDSSSKAFVYDFKIWKDTDLLVILTTTDGVDITLTLNTDYTVAGAGAEGGGTITLVVALLTGQYLTILRQLPLTQEADYAEGDSFPAQAHENALDRGVMISQQLSEQLGRSLKLPMSSAFKDIALPDPVAGQFLMGNETSDGFINGQPVATTQVVSNMNVAGFVKNTAEGVLVGGQTDFPLPTYLYGLLVKTNATTPNTKLDASISRVTLTDNNGHYVTISGANLTTLDLSQAGSIGVAGGIKSAVLAANTFYYLFVIYNGTTAALWLDTSATPTLPTGYAYYRLISAPPKTDGSNHFRKFTQTDREVVFYAVIQELSNNTNTSYTALTLQYVPALAYKAEFALLVGGAGNAYLSMDGVNDLYSIVASVLQIYVSMELPEAQKIYYKVASGVGLLLYTRKYFLNL